MLEKIENLGKVAMTVEKDYYSPDKCYDKLTVVQDKNLGTYISRKPVPANKELTDRNYWIPIIAGPGSNGNEEEQNTDSETEFKGVLKAKWGFVGDGYDQSLQALQMRWVTNNYTVFDNIELSIQDKNYIREPYDLMDILLHNFDYGALNPVYDALGDAFYEAIGGSQLDIEWNANIDKIINYGIDINNIQGTRLPYKTLAQNMAEQDLPQMDYINDSNMLVHECKGIAWRKFFNYIELFIQYANSNGGGGVIRHSVSTNNSKKSSSDNSRKIDKNELIETFRNSMNDLRERFTRNRNTKSQAIDLELTPIQNGVIDENYIQQCVNLMFEDLNNMGMICMDDHVDVGIYMGAMIKIFPIIYMDIILNRKPIGINNGGGTGPKSSKALDHGHYINLMTLINFMYEGVANGYFSYGEDVTELGCTTSELMQLTSNTYNEKYIKIFEELNNILVWPTDDNNNPLYVEYINFYKYLDKFYILWDRIQSDTPVLKISRIGNIEPNYNDYGSWEDYMNAWYDNNHVGGGDSNGGNEQILNSTPIGDKSINLK